jgi:hypothetical protein
MDIPPYLLTTELIDDGVSRYAVDFLVLDTNASNPVLRLKADYVCQEKRCVCEYDNVEVEKNGTHYKLPLTKLNTKIEALRKAGLVLTKLTITVYLSEDVVDPSVYKVLP